MTMPIIKTDYLASLLQDYDKGKGSFRKTAGYFFTSLGADQADVGCLRALYNNLINKPRELDKTELFQLGRILAEAKTEAGSESRKVFDQLARAYGDTMTKGLKLLRHCHDDFNTFTMDSFDMLLASEQPYETAVDIVTKTILKSSDLPLETCTRLLPDILKHATPVALAYGLWLIGRFRGSNLYSETNLDRIMKSVDPERTAREIVCSVMMPGLNLDNSYTTGILGRATIFYHSLVNYSAGAKVMREHDDAAWKIQQDQAEKSNYKWF